MARKKKTEEVVEEVQSIAIEESAPEIIEEVAEAPIEEVVEEKPKAKRGRKAKVEEPIVEETTIETISVEEVVVDPTPVEEPIVEEVKVEEPIVEEIPIIEETPVVEKKSAKKTKVVKAEVVVPTETSATQFVARVTASMIQSRKGPGLAYHVARNIYKGTVVHISAVEGNWGQISKNTWVNLNFVEKI